MPEFIVGLKLRARAHSVAVYSGSPKDYERSHEYVIGPFPDGESADLFRQFADRGSQSFRILLEVIKACQRKPNKLRALLLNEMVRPAAGVPSGVAAPQLESTKHQLESGK